MEQDARQEQMKLNEKLHSDDCDISAAGKYDTPFLILPPSCIHTLYSLAASEPLYNINWLHFLALFCCSPHFISVPTVVDVILFFSYKPLACCSLVSLSISCYYYLNFHCIVEIHLRISLSHLNCGSIITSIDFKLSTTVCQYIFFFHNDFPCKILWPRQSSFGAN